MPTRKSKKVIRRSPKKSARSKSRSPRRVRRSRAKVSRSRRPVRKYAYRMTEEDIKIAEITRISKETVDELDNLIRTNSLVRSLNEFAKRGEVMTHTDDRQKLVYDALKLIHKNMNRIRQYLNMENYMLALDAAQNSWCALNIAKRYL